MLGLFHMLEWLCSMPLKFTGREKLKKPLRNQAVKESRNSTKHSWNSLSPQLCWSGKNLLSWQRSQLTHWLSLMYMHVQSLKNSLNLMFLILTDLNGSNNFAIIGNKILMTRNDLMFNANVLLLFSLMVMNIWATQVVLLSHRLQTNATWLSWVPSSWISVVHQPAQQVQAKLNQQRISPKLWQNIASSSTAQAIWPTRWWQPSSKDLRHLEPGVVSTSSIESTSKCCL